MKLDDRRLESLDALRGFDMLWIVGLDGLVGALRGITGWPWLGTLANQLEHVDWEGFHFEDLIFPLFVFITGVAIVFSLDKARARHGTWGALRRVFRRSVLLFALGLFYYGGLSHRWPEIRVLGVLQRIALCYLGASLLYSILDLRGLVLACAALLLGYWALLALVAVPGIGAGHYAESANLTNYVDRMWLPGQRYDGDHDPEGLLSTLPAVATCLLGVLAGTLLKHGRSSPARKAGILAVAGLAGLGLGMGWGHRFPVIKKIWTSSYVLVAGGWSALLLAAFYWVVDVLGFRLWARPFAWVGANAITVYLATNLLSFDDVARRLGGGDLAARLSPFGELWLALLALGLVLALARFLHRRGIFLRV